MEAVEWCSLSPLIQLKAWDQSCILTAVIMNSDVCRTHVGNAHGCGGPVVEVGRGRLYQRWEPEPAQGRLSLLIFIDCTIQKFTPTFTNISSYKKTPIVKVGQPVQYVFIY